MINKNNKSIKPVLISTFVLASLAFGGFGIWGATAPIEGAVIASGKLTPEGSRRTIQHLEGGSIKSIYAREGQMVKAGDILIELDDIRVVADRDSLYAELMLLQTSHDRLIAEVNNEDFVDDVEDSIYDSLSAQVKLFHARRQQRQNRSNILKQRIEQVRAELQGNSRRMNLIGKELKILQEEHDAKAKLVKKGYATKTAQRDILLAMSSLQKELEEERAARSRNSRSITETELEITSIHTELLEEATAQLAELNTKIVEVERRLRASNDALARLKVRAPVSGRIIDMRFKTTGGVVPPAEPILDIVPLDENLVVEARISPTDVEQIHADQDVDISLSAFDMRSVPKISGKVLNISADSKSEQGAEPFYIARISLNEDEINAVNVKDKLEAGMPADAFIKTGSHSLFAYLAEPVIDSIDRSFRQK